MIVISVTNADVIEKVRASLRPDHLLLDLVGIRCRDLACEYSGLSW